MLRRTPWSRIKGQNSVDKEFLEIVGNGKPTGSVWKETIAVSATMSISVGKVTPSNPFPNSFMRQNERKPSRTRSPSGKSPSGRMSRWPCKDYLRGTYNNSFCEKNDTLQNACTTRPRVVVGLERSAHSHTVRLMNSRRKGLKRIMTKVLWLC